MRVVRIIPCALGVLWLCASVQRISAQAPAHEKRIAIAAGTVLDGKGGVLHNARIVVEGAKIVAVATKAEAGAKAGPGTMTCAG